MLGTGFWVGEWDGVRISGWVLIHHYALSRTMVLTMNSFF